MKDLENSDDGTGSTVVNPTDHLAITRNAYESPHARERNPDLSSISRLTWLATRWLGVYFVAATLVGTVVFALRTRRHQLDTPFSSLGSLAAYAWPHFSRMVVNGALAVLLLKGRSRLGAAAFVLQLLTLAVSADRIVAMMAHGVSVLSILPTMNAPLSVIATGLLAFGPPNRAQVWMGIVAVCICIASMLLLEILQGREW